MSKREDGRTGLTIACVIRAMMPADPTFGGVQAVSQTGSAAPEGGGEIQPLIIYNCVHHREGNPIDCTGDAVLLLAAQIYNAVLMNQFHMSQSQMDKCHPLNFATIGSGSMNGMLDREMDALVNIARGDAEAQAVMLRNYQSLSDAMLAKAADAQADVVATLGTLDATIRGQSPTMVLNRG